MEKVRLLLLELIRKQHKIRKSKSFMISQKSSNFNSFSKIRLKINTY